MPITERSIRKLVSDKARKGVYITRRKRKTKAVREWVVTVSLGDRIERRIAGSHKEALTSLATLVRCANFKFSIVATGDQQTEGGESNGQR